MAAVLKLYGSDSICSHRCQQRSAPSNYSQDESTPRNTGVLYHLLSLDERDPLLADRDSFVPPQRVKSQFSAHLDLTGESYILRRGSNHQVHRTLNSRKHARAIIPVVKGSLRVG
jgi:hypothetical protein